MSSRPQAKSSVAALLDRAVDVGRRHPGRVVLVLFVISCVLYGTGVWEPLDWWGNEEVGR